MQRPKHHPNGAWSRDAAPANPPHGRLKLMPEAGRDEISRYFRNLLEEQEL